MIQLFKLLFIYIFFKCTLESEQRWLAFFCHQIRNCTAQELRNYYCNALFITMLYSISSVCICFSFSETVLLDKAVQLMFFFIFLESYFHRTQTSFHLNKAVALMYYVLLSFWKWLDVVEGPYRTEYWRKITWLSCGSFEISSLFQWKHCSPMYRLSCFLKTQHVGWGPLCCKSTVAG